VFLCSFVALLDMDGVSHSYALEWSACLSDPAKSLVVAPDRNFSKSLFFGMFSALCFRQ
jgi:hypothetical protein